jgi:hypothetical protein
MLILDLVEEGRITVPEAVEIIESINTDMPDELANNNQNSEAEITINFVLA